MVRPPRQHPLQGPRGQHCQVADLLAVMSGARAGHYLAFFPSYSYLQQVWEDFTARYPDQPTLCQESAMDEGKRAEFLAQFQKSDGRSLLGFAVLGGVFGEGVDLRGRASSVQPSSARACRRSARGRSSCAITLNRRAAPALTMPTASPV